MAGTTFQELLDGVANYYGSGSDQWAEIARYGVNQQTLPIIQQVPGVTVTVSNSGKYLGYDYSNPFASTTNPVSVIDSNVQTGAYGTGSFNAQLPSTVITNPSTGTSTMQSGAISTGSGSTIATIADKTGLAVIGVSLGTKLGKLIDSGIYAINPDWWDAHYPSINPQTWDDMVTTEGGKSFVRSIFGLENDSATMYLDERLLAYTYMMLLQEGAYDAADGEIDISGLTNLDLPLDTLENTTHIINVQQSVNIAAIGAGSYRGGRATITGAEYIIAQATTSSGDVVFYGVSQTPFTYEKNIYYPNGTLALTNSGGSTPVTYNDITYHVAIIPNDYIYYYSAYTQYLLVSRLYNNNGTLYAGYSNNAAWCIAYFIYHGVAPSGGMPGVSDNENAGTHITPANVINPSTGSPVTPSDNIDDVLQALKTAYPNLFNNTIYEDVPQDDGTIQRITYIPTPYPNTTNINQPVTQVNPGIDPQLAPDVTSDNYPDTITQQLTDSLTDTPTAPDTGDGNTPPAIIPTGSANALYSIYNPTQGELNSFGSWLWSSNFVDQLLKLFNDPMQAIIGLHKVFAQPVISGTSTIKVGYLDSQVSSNVVGNQYTSIDCGTVNVSEYFGNVFDYDPFTQIYIYLPFVGIERLDTGDVMRGVIGVKYHVDVLTGACLAEITVTRDGAGGILYTFAGNCAVQYPVSSGSYMGIVASLASIAGGVVGTIASGGALAPVAMGAVSGIMNAHTRVNHSGAFSGNAGAMGVKKPYLIITRPQTCLADNFPDFDGYPANKTTTLSACSGFVKCETCHVENVPATDAELSEIEMLLKGGIII